MNKTEELARLTTPGEYPWLDRLMRGQAMRLKHKVPHLYKTQGRWAMSPAYHVKHKDFLASQFCRVVNQGLKWPC